MWTSRSKNTATTTSGRAEKGGYLIPKIRELRVTLKDRSRPLEERRQALRFLVHFVEDLHMPMHVGENHDQGGNRLQVRFFDRGSNLHSRLGHRDHHAGPAERGSVG